MVLEWLLRVVGGGEEGEYSVSGTLIDSLRGLSVDRGGNSIIVSDFIIRVRCCPLPLLLLLLLLEFVSSMLESACTPLKLLTPPNLVFFFLSFFCSLSFSFSLSFPLSCSLSLPGLS